MMMIVIKTLVKYKALEFFIIQNLMVMQLDLEALFLI